MPCSELKQKFNKDCFSKSTVAKENNKKFEITLSNNICKIKVDECFDEFLNKAHQKCDYLMINMDNKEYYFIELKGKDFQKAYAQICTTIKDIKKIIEINKNQIYGFIVTSRIPSNSNQLIQKFKIDFIKSFGKKLEVKNNLFILK